MLTVMGVLCVEKVGVFSSPKCRDRFWGPPVLLLWVPGFFTGAQWPGRDVQHWLPLMLRLSGAITLLPLYAFTWTGTSA
jgi:hypothetical protein